LSVIMTRGGMIADFRSLFMSRCAARVSLRRWTKGVHWAGAALAFTGLIVAPASAGRFVLRRTTLNPVGQPAHLVVGGAHAWSRNPMYLSLTIIYAGVALALGKVWPLVPMVLPWAAMNWVVIPFEEARLREAFGQAYVDYCSRVRRWL
jgi:protein-S-isoprenylcysteine O-methyltransferase Ste14